MHDIILVYPSISVVSRGPYVPHGILSIASFLVDNGYNVKIVDENVGDYVEQELHKALKDPVICVGVSTMTGPQIRNALRASGIVRQINPDVPIVWGGVHSTLLPEQTIRNDRIDIVVRGEGEKASLELVQHLESGKSLRDIRGITFKEKDKVVSTQDRVFCDLNSLPRINYKLIDLRRYFSNVGDRRHAVNIWTSKGCPYRCGFCYNAGFHKRRWRGRKAEGVIEEVDTLVGDYKVDGLFIGDDDFFVDKRRIEKVCQGIKPHNLLCRVECRIDRLLSFDEDFLNLMVKSGVRYLGLGAESGSQRMLDLMEKDQKVEQILKSAELCKKYGLTPFYSFMIGIPWEKPEDVEATLDVVDQILAINPEARVAVPIFVPYPGAKLYDLCLQQGIRLPSSLEEWQDHIPTGGSRNWIHDPEKVTTIMISSLLYLEKFEDHSIFIRRGKRSLITKMLFGVGMQHLSRKIEGFRWRKRFWRFPIEAKLYIRATQRALAHAQ